jgi:predicted dienelactone hydrolase
MRPLEIALIAAVGVGLLGWTAGAVWARTTIAGGLIGAVLAAHLVFEGARLPLAVAYLAAALLTARAFRRRAAGADGGSSGSAVAVVGRGLVGLVTLVLALAPPVLLPVFVLPAPTGPFAVGGTAFAVVDSSRNDPFAPAGAVHPRTFPVRVWYPAPPGTRGRLVRYAATPELTSPIVPMLKPVLVDQYRYVKTHTVAEAPLAVDGAPFPVLVFSHGYTAYSSQNTPQMEELASRGYVVFSIAHTYDATAAVFPDGQVIGLDPQLIRTMGGALSNGDSVRAAVAAKLEALGRAGTPVDRQARFREYMATNPERITRSYPVWAADTRFLIDYLERGATGGKLERFASKLDLAGVGIFGMSFGGSNAGEVCRTDRRCRAGVNIDGQQFGPLIDDSLTVPFMILASETALPVHRAIFDRLRGPGYLLRLKGSQHAGLMDLPLLAPLLLRKTGLIGTMPIRRSEQVMSDYLVAFFDTHLRHRPAELLSRADPGPDLELTVVNR